MHAASVAAAAAAVACMRACVAACVIDTMYQLIYTRRRPGRGESNFRVEIFEKNGPGQKVDLGKLLPELTLLSWSNLLEYFLYENPILHARPKCTFGVGRPNIPVLKLV
jgi:hypothetical protein